MISNIISLLMMKTLSTSIICDADECLSFIVVFLDLLTIFFLVFSSYIKINEKVKRIFGYSWSAFIMVSSVVVLAIHTCIFTLGGVIFTAMAIAAVLSQVLESLKKEKGSIDVFEFMKKDAGCYVIFPTDDDKFVFGLHNRRNQLLALSTYKYESVEEAKEAISLSKSCGSESSFEDATKSWVIDAKHPKFRMYLEEQNYLFELAISDDFSILRSKPTLDAQECLRKVKDARKCVTSNILYFATAKSDIMNGDDFLSTKKSAPKKEKAKKSAESLKEDNNEESSEEGQSLSEILAEAKTLAKNEVVNKQYIADYLTNKYPEKLEINRRGNKTKSGLPLADTHYVFIGKSKKCFIYVYETEGSVMLLLNMKEALAEEIAKKHKHVHQSLFPKAKDKWYSVIIDDTFASEEVNEILDKVLSLYLA